MDGKLSGHSPSCLFALQGTARQLLHVPVPARGASQQPAFAPGVWVLMPGIALGPYGKHVCATWAGLFASTAATATETDCTEGHALAPKRSMKKAPIQVQCRSLFWFSK